MIITLTLNPAMDKVFILDQFEFNVTNRIRRSVECVGGKGTHVSVNLSLLGVGSIATGIVRGKTGKAIQAAMRKYPNIDVRFLYFADGCSRTNYAIVENSNCTLIAEKGDMLTDGHLEKFFAHVGDMIHPGDIVLLSGDASNTNGTPLQDRLIDMIRRQGAHFCLDANGENLASGIRKSPLLVKPNMDELQMLMGERIREQQDILGAMRRLSGYGIRYILVSCGSEGSYLMTDGKAYRVTVPSIPIVNTVGCGDALVAGFLAGLEKGMPIPGCLQYANAVSCAAAVHQATVGFSVPDVDRYRAQVLVKQL